jgi:hypothetical protein
LLRGHKYRVWFLFGSVSFACGKSEFLIKLRIFS